MVAGASGTFMSVAGLVRQDEAHLQPLVLSRSSVSQVPSSVTSLYVGIVCPFLGPDGTGKARRGPTPSGGRCRPSPSPRTLTGQQPNLLADSPPGCVSC